MANTHKFPKAAAYALNKPVVFCPKDTVLALYHLAHPDIEPLTSLTVKIAKWFHTEAQSYGWAGAVLSPTVGTRHHAGCLLLASKEVLVVFVGGSPKGA